jgi:exodeoxyribonuclease VII small subunit
MTRPNERSGDDAPSESSFEDRLEELDALVARLESGDLGLEESIAVFERGRKLQKELAAELAAFERRIDVLTRTPSGEDAEVAAPELDPDGAEASAEEAPKKREEAPKRRKRATPSDDDPCRTPRAPLKTSFRTPRVERTPPSIASCRAMTPRPSTCIARCAIRSSPAASGFGPLWR